jgi:16S rRNA (uracil1498-N3)-methyltransferase
VNQIILHRSENISPHRFLIQDPLKLNHINNIIKPKIFNSLDVCIVDEGLASGKIIELSQDAIIIEILHINKPHTHPQIHLLTGLSRPLTCQKILEHATSMGVHSFTFFQAKLSEKSYAQSKLFVDKKYLDYCEKGLSQSKQYFQLPNVILSPTLPILPQDQSLKFVLSPNAKDWLDDFDIHFNQPITLALGPERGFIPQEVDFFKKQGFHPIKVSHSILRVETAVFYILAQLELLRRKATKQTVEKKI